MKASALLMTAILPLLTFTVGCGDTGSDASAASVPIRSQQASASTGCTGTILETMSSGGYTYVKVDCGGPPIWAAGPEATVAVGQKVSLPPAVPMKDFHSSTLNRSFETIWFVADIRPVGPTGTPAHESAGTRDAIARAHQSSGTSGGQRPMDFSGIDRPEGGKTVAEIFSEKARLSGKEIIFCGKVVKSLANIMGRNWIHVQDGTGESGANDLTVTTHATAKVGDTVRVKGRVTLDKDFGLGYRYEVLIEDATVTVGACR